MTREINSCLSCVMVEDPEILEIGRKGWKGVAIHTISEIFLALG